MKKVSASREGRTQVVVLYIRVSTDKQREEGYSIEIQKERLNAYARSLFPDASLVEYVDDGFSGGYLDRPMIQKLIQDVQAKRITHVIVLKLDRLSRSQKDTLYLIEDVFLPNGVSFISMSESFNTATPFGRAVLGILSVFAQLERENIYERTRSGMAKRVEMGYWPGGGHVPFGYDYDSEKGILVPNQDAETVRRMHRLYQAGHSCQAIADLCGLKRDRVVSVILTRRSSLGLIPYNGREYPGRHEPIITQEMYDRTCRMMAERSQRKYVSATEHLLTGLIYCGKCGARMRYQKWGEKGEKLVCYSRQRSAKPYMIKDPDCDNPSPWAREVEETVCDLLFRRAGGQAEEPEKAPSVLDTLREQQAELRRKLRRLYDLYAAAADEILLSAIRDTKEHLSVLEEKISREEKQKAVTIRAAEIHSRLDTLAECWPLMTTGEKRQILHEVIDRVTVTGDHVHIDFRY